jgi:hypothetical protein
MINDFLLKDIMSKLSSDSKFVGVMMMVAGVLTCLTIVGIPFGIPIIFSGMRAKEGGSQMERYMFSSEENDKLMAYESFQKHFFIIKVLMIIGIVGAVLSLIFLFGVIMSLIGALVKMGGH